MLGPYRPDCSDDFGHWNSDAWMQSQKSRVDLAAMQMYPEIDENTEKCIAAAGLQLAGTLVPRISIRYAGTAAKVGRRFSDALPCDEAIGE